MLYALQEAAFPARAGDPVQPAYRNDKLIRPFLLATSFARVLHRPLSLPENRGRREDRVHAAPAISCAIAHKERAHEHTGTGGASRPSLRSGFTAYFVLSPVNGFFATVASEKLRFSRT